MEYSKGKRYIKKNFRSQSQYKNVNDSREQRLLYGIKNFFKKNMAHNSANNYRETDFNSNKIFDQFWPVKSSGNKDINLNLKKSTEDKK